MPKKRYHKIANAHAAFWFVHDHPKFQRMVRNEVTSEVADALEKKGFLVSWDKGGRCYQYHRHLPVPAITENLTFSYMGVNEKGVHDSDSSKNTRSECWLEFGPVEYGYVAGGEFEWDDETGEMNYHDYRLDCGGSTFDEALVRLAKNVRKFYGDYKPRKRVDACGPAPCADCGSLGKISQKLGLSK